MQAAIDDARLACISHHPTVEAHDTTARTSLRLLAVLNVLFKYACARQAGSRLVLTALSRTSPRRVVKMQARSWGGRALGPSIRTDEEWLLYFSAVRDDRNPQTPSLSIGRPDRARPSQLSIFLLDSNVSTSAHLNSIMIDVFELYLLLAGLDLVNVGCIADEMHR